MKGISKAVAVAVVAGSMAISQAWAANINNLIVGGPNQASDEDREFLINRVGPDDGVVDVGDSLRGVINFNTMNSVGANLGGITGNDEFTGLFQVIVTSIGAPVGGLSPVTLAPDPAFAATLTGLGLTPVGGEVIALFTDPSIDFCADDPCTIPASESSATDGTFWATVGFTGAAGEGIGGVAPADIDLAAGITSGSSAGFINAGLNLISTGAGFGAGITINSITPSPFGGFVDFAVTQNLKGISDLDTPYQISTNTDVSFNATVIPEPSTLLLFGGGLLGLGFLARRRHKKA
jgi:hypothetical protein